MFLTQHRDLVRGSARIHPSPTHLPLGASVTFLLSPIGVTSSAVLFLVIWRTNQPSQQKDGPGGNRTLILFATGNMDTHDLTTKSINTIIIQLAQKKTRCHNKTKTRSSTSVLQKNSSAAASPKNWRRTLPETVSSSQGPTKKPCTRPGLLDFF